MDPIETPLLSNWGGEIHHVCFNDACNYFLESWNSLENQGIENTGYRCRMDPRGCCGPQPVWSKDALKDLVLRDPDKPKGTLDFYNASDFQRDVEDNDSDFYEKPRMVDHLDSLALATVEELLSRLTPERAKILDLMAGPNSHIPEQLKPASITGVGLNREELEANPAVTDAVIHDINANSVLPFEDDTFDMALLTVSVQYVTQPVELFREVSRVVKPGGRFLVTFSNRFFPPKAVNIWKASNDTQRKGLVRGYFNKSENYIIEGDFESSGKPRPEDDKYYELGIPSDPVYAVWGKVNRQR
jgi:SAM-dependent methyltransferase